MLGQLVLLVCIAAGMIASCILFVLFGPVPVKRKVTIVPRHAPPDVFVAQPRITPQQVYATALEPDSAPAPLPRSRSARGTTGPRNRPSEEIQTDRVPRVAMDTDSFLVDGQ